MKKIVIFLIITSVFLIQSLIADADLENKLREKDIELNNHSKELEKYKPDITTITQKKIASNYAICKYSYFLYAFECDNMKYKCSITRQKDFATIRLDSRCARSGRMVRGRNGGRLRRTCGSATAGCESSQIQSDEQAINERGQKGQASLGLA